jgi:hypothetical protein
MKKITTILDVFALAIAFILPSVFIEEDHMQLYINPPINNKVEPTIGSGTYYESYSHYPKS